MDRHDRPASFSFRYLDVIGNGTFGIVCRARDLGSGEVVAIKTVYQDEGHQVFPGKEQLAVSASR